MERLTNSEQFVDLGLINSLAADKKDKKVKLETIYNCGFKKQAHNARIKDQIQKH